MLRDLITVIHYALLFHVELGIDPHELLFPAPEESILRAGGPVFTNLIRHIYVTCASNKSIPSRLLERPASASEPETTKAEGDASSDLSTTPSHTEDAEKTTAPVISASSSELDVFMANVSKLQLEDMLSTLSSMVSLSASADMIRARIIPKQAVEAATRLKASVRDAQGTGFVWLRGFEGCASGRVVACGRVWAGQDLSQVAEALDIRGRSGGGKADLFVAAWLRERLSICSARADSIRAAFAEAERLREEAEREAEKKRQEAEKEAEEKRKETERRLKKVEAKHPSCLLVSGEKIEVTQCGRGRRERRTINYNDLMVDGKPASEDNESGEDDDDDEEDEEFEESDEEEEEGKDKTRGEDDDDEEEEDEEEDDSVEPDMNMQGPRTRRRARQISEGEEARETRGRKRARAASKEPEERVLRRSSRRVSKADESSPDDSGCASASAGDSEEGNEDEAEDKEEGETDGKAGSKRGRRSSGAGGGGGTGALEGLRATRSSRRQSQLKELSV